MKYAMTDETIKVGSATLRRIKALRSFANVKEGELGGWIEREGNLDHEGDCWVGGEAKVYQYACVYHNARVLENAMVCGEASVCVDAEISGEARVHGSANVREDARVYGEARIYGDAVLAGDAHACGKAEISGDALVARDALVQSPEDIIWFSHVGSENKTLTAYKTKEGEIEVMWDYFTETVQGFKDILKGTHGDNQLAKEYLLLADVIELRFKSAQAEKACGKKHA